MTRPIPRSTDRRFEAIVESISRHAAKRKTDGLVAYHKVGELVDQLPAVYRSDRFGSLARALTERGVKGMQSGTLRKCWRFAKQIDGETLERLIAAEASWRDASRLTTRRIRDDERESLVSQLQKNLPEHKNLGELISRKSGAYAVASARAIDTAHQRAISAIRHLQKVRKLAQLSDDFRSRIDRALADIKGAVS